MVRFGAKKEESFLLFYFTNNRLDYLFGGLKMVCNHFPINDIKKSIYIVGSAVLVVEIVGVFPNIKA
jgi:hypothetical protein